MLSAVSREGFTIVEAEKAVLLDNRVGCKTGLIIGQQIIEALVDISYRILQQIVVLNAIIHKLL
jgi:hypothetical protein